MVEIPTTNDGYWARLLAAGVKVGKIQAGILPAGPPYTAPPKAPPSQLAPDGE